MNGKPFIPTTHPPGSEQKIEVMAQRLANHLPIHHPNDVTFEVGGTVGHSRKWLFGDGVAVQEGVSE